MNSLQNNNVDRRGRQVPRLKLPMIAKFPTAINELAEKFENKPPIFPDKVYQKKLKFMTCKFSAEGHGTIMTNFLSFMNGEQVGQLYDFETDKD